MIRKQIFHNYCPVCALIFWAILFTNHSELTAQSPQLAPPVFSENAGYVSDNFQLEITHPEEAEIRFTLDGSEPDNESSFYVNQISFDDYTDQRLRFIRTTPFEADARGFGWRIPGNEIPHTLVVKAKAFKAGFEPSETVTATFLKENLPHELPVISITTNNEHLFGESSGIYVPGDIYNRQGWNHQDYWGRPNANYHQRGEEWERPAHLELIELDGSVYKQNIGIRIHGGGSRVLPQKAFRLYSRSRYGESRFRYDMFGDGETGYNRLILRNSGQDFFQKPTMFIDAFSQNLVSTLTFDTQKYRPFAVYVNGEYWGIKNLRERYDHHYLKRNYDVEADEIDYLEHTPADAGNVKAGSIVNYNTVLDSLEQNHVNDLGGMEFIERHVDVKNFTEILAAQIYFANIDWPGNNNEFWRFTGSPEGRGSPKDGRYRWMMFDMDFGFSHLDNTGYEADLFSHLLSTQNIVWSNHPRSTLMFRKFIQHTGFRNRYINTQMDLLNTLFKEEHVVELLEQFREIYRSEMVNHIKRWGYPRTIQEWEGHIRERIEFAQNRPRVVRHQISGRFGARSPVPVTIHNSNPGNGTVQINSIVLSGKVAGVPEQPFPWQGIYFTEIPIELIALPEPGFSFDHWEIGGEVIYQQRVTFKPRQDMVIRAYFSETPDPGDGKELLYFWYFDEHLPNNSPLENLDASYSSTGYTGTMTYNPAIRPYPPPDEDHTDGIMDRVNDPTSLNYRLLGNTGLAFNPEEMRGVRVRNPSRTEHGESSLFFKIPAEEFQDLVFSFAARRTNSGQENMIFHYSLSSGEPQWTQHSLKTSVVTTAEEYHLVMIDLSDIDGHAHNPHLKVKVTFDGENVTGFSGNTRFNNIAVFGLPYTWPRIEDITESGLEPNFPNPFHESTTIPYRVLSTTQVKLDIFSPDGKHIQTLEDVDREPGFYSAQFKANGLASGVYIIRMQAGEQVDHQKIMLIK